MLPRAILPGFKVTTAMTPAYKQAGEEVRVGETQAERGREKEREKAA